MQSFLDEVVLLGAKVSIYQDDRILNLEYLNNLISSYEGIANDREALDDKMFNVK